MARHPQATALKLVKGTRKDRINFDEPIPADGKVTAPAALSTKAKRLWNELAPDLIRQGVLTVWDRSEFAVWCEAVIGWREAQAIVNREGQILTDSKGNRVRHPATILARDYAQTILSYGSRFGMTPSDRSKLTRQGAQAEGKGKDPKRFLT